MQALRVITAIGVAMSLACERPPAARKDGKTGGHPGADAGAPRVVAAAVETIGGWESVEGVTLALVPTVKDCDEGHLGRVDAVVKAQHTADTVAIRVSWPDATKSDSHKSLSWDEAAGAYKAGPDREDRVSLMFDMEGDFSSCMLEGKTFRADVWHWKAARTGPAGFAHDKYHIYSLTEVHPKSAEYESPDGKPVFIARPSDAGDKLYSSTKAPAAKGPDTLPGYTPNAAAAGSIADVRAEAVHDGRGWTVTMTRRLDTGHDDDVAFEKGRSYKAAAACFDRSGDDHHSTAGFVLVIE
jgi:hypothetical protein